MDITRDFIYEHFGNLNVFDQLPFEDQVSRIENLPISNEDKGQVCVWLRMHNRIGRPENDDLPLIERWNRLCPVHYHLRYIPKEVQEREDEFFRNYDDSHTRQMTRETWLNTLSKRLE